MDKNELEDRTKRFALRVIRFVAGLPKNKVTDVMGYQLLKAGASVGANYREANRAVSRNDFIAKTCAEHSRSIGIVEKEAAETEYWLALFDESDIAIRVENPCTEPGRSVSKLYHIGKAQQRHDTLRDVLSSSAFRRQGSGVRHQVSLTPDP